jgi:hypothetical protein
VDTLHKGDNDDDDDDDDDDNNMVLSNVCSPEMWLFTPDCLQYKSIQHMSVYYCTFPSIISSSHYSIPINSSPDLQTFVPLSSYE